MRMRRFQSLGGGLQQATVKTYGTAIMQGYVSLHTCGLVVIA